MPEYNIAIVGLITVVADSGDEAIAKVKNMFYDDELTIDDLHFDIDKVED